MIPILPPIAIMSGTSHLLARSDLCCSAMLLHMHDPTEPIWHILRYVLGTLDHSLWLFASPVPRSPRTLMLYLRVHTHTRRSTPGYRVFLGSNLLSRPPNARQLSLSLVMRPSIGVSHMQLLKHLGFVIYFVSSMLPYTRQWLCIVTMVVLSTWLPILFNISALNTLT